MEKALIIIHVIISIILIVTVLMQQGKQQGLSGAIAGGAETFFGKNKGRTIDGVLKKVTAIIAILFVVTSITLAIVSTHEKKADATAQQQIEAPVETPAETPAQ
jgi:preprotein translocase subunit SecG